MTRALISIAASIAITASAAQGQQSSYAHLSLVPGRDRSGDSRRSHRFLTHQRTSG
jgi:hypothetical protein